MADLNDITLQLLKIEGLLADIKGALEYQTVVLGNVIAAIDALEK